jgi:hypothetical protein
VHEVHAAEAGTDDENVGFEVVGILISVASDAWGIQADICAKRHVEAIVDGQGLVRWG